MELLDAVKVDVSLSPFQISKIVEIDNLINEDAVFIKRKVVEDFEEKSLRIDDDTLNEGIFNLKLYYVVALLDPKNRHAVSERVDPFWHSHILHTELYHKFCNKVFNQYVHHKPLNKMDIKACEEVDRLYSYTLDVYHNIFKKELIDGLWWPENNQVCTHMDLYDPDIFKEGLFERVTH
jgi:hypothetical protein